MKSILFLCMLLQSDEVIDDFNQALQNELKPGTTTAVEAEQTPANPLTPAVVDLTPKPQVQWEVVAKAATTPKPYFVFFKSGSCSPCRRMEADGITEALENAGCDTSTINIDETPHEGVDVVPQLWLCERSGEPIRRFIGYTTASKALETFKADGVCRIRVGDNTWSGVAISESLVLTVAHHDETEGFFVEFPSSFGSSTYARVSAELISSNKDADLSVLQINPPELVTVQPYSLSSLPEDAIELPGYLSGKDPKNISIRNLRRIVKAGGFDFDTYLGAGIVSPQFGMSGSPLLTKEKQIAGLQSGGKGGEIVAIKLDTIRKFMETVDSDQSSVTASVSNAEPSSTVVASLLAEHLNRSSTAPKAGLFEIGIDTPESTRGWIADLLSKESIEFPSSGVSASWKGSDRTISVASGRLRINPGATVSVRKFGVSLSTTLRGVSYASDLSWCTLELDGAPDLTVRFN
jgi:hypothetical protein